MTVDGETITDVGLDDCDGHEHDIEWDGVSKQLYHYHSTHEFPYALGCLRGQPHMTLDLPAIKRTNMRRQDRGFQPRVSPDGKAMPR
ncbi:MAG: hypothetical protein CMQ05_15385 [Gammaproteobacteria bacterium]|uniref:Uncharacterized protein n=1 Tax=OM182 bacterium MED-G24 TaxID=1986255 RepID=A0A2A5WWM9_9GAMM|nr:hypothetical protein [Gammaproteobacteria bacterium]PDH40614.1 MAG: hypothetical protein CNE99_03375 [OM182 bacterium MED-G24]RPG26059.1 MAG: hypothetical protein CBC10_005330 [Gammaproteobacteria bacterium TMED50]|tara:strand:+ start:1543 stop:1803 length:261 start_codon:yes stop_codon:yes gene_type:complete